MDAGRQIELLQQREQGPVAGRYRRVTPPLDPFGGLEYGDDAAGLPISQSKRRAEHAAAHDRDARPVPGLKGSGFAQRFDHGYCPHIISVRDTRGK